MIPISTDLCNLVVHISIYLIEHLDMESLRAYPNNRGVMRPSPDISGRPRRQAKNARRRRKAKMSRDEIKGQALQFAERWQALIGTNGIKSKADLARYLGVSKARVTKVMSRLPL